MKPLHPYGAGSAESTTGLFEESAGVGDSGRHWDLQC